MRLAGNELPAKPPITAGTEPTAAAPIAPAATHKHPRCTAQSVSSENGTQRAIFWQGVRSGTRSGSGNKTGIGGGQSQGGVCEIIIPLHLLIFVIASNALSI